MALNDVVDRRPSGVGLGWEHEQAAYLLGMEMAIPRVDELYAAVFLTVPIRINVYKPDDVQHAGVAGIEPALCRLTADCLTTWPYAIE